MKIVVSSDWHLDARTDGVPRFDEIEQAIDRSVEVAKLEQADLYVMVGDLCDPDGWCPTRAISVAVQLYQVGIDSIWVAGNHDVVEDGMGTTTLTPLVAADIAHHVFEQPGEIMYSRKGKGKIHVVGLPFTPSSHAYDPVITVRRMSKPNAYPTLVLGHLNIEGISAGSETRDMARGREVFWPIDAVRKRWPQAVCIGGHYHRAQEFKTIHIAGSLCRLRHDEEENNPSLMVIDV
jgi:DNA repair exonuclease SbcCD nuclease subunit